MPKTYCAHLSNAECSDPCRIMKQGGLRGRCGPRGQPLTDLQKQLITGAAQGGPGFLAQAQEAAAGAVDALVGGGQAIGAAVAAPVVAAGQALGLGAPADGQPPIAAAREPAPLATADLLTLSPFEISQITGMSVGQIRQLKASRFAGAPARRRSRRKRATTSKRRVSKRRRSKRRKRTSSRRRRRTSSKRRSSRRRSRRR